jgi:hypothetical protein
MVNKEQDALISEVMAKLEAEAGNKLPFMVGRVYIRMACEQVLAKCIVLPIQNDAIHNAETLCTCGHSEDSHSRWDHACRYIPIEGEYCGCMNFKEAKA